MMVSDQTIELAGIFTYGDATEAANRRNLLFLPLLPARPADALAGAGAVIAMPVAKSAVALPVAAPHSSPEHRPGRRASGRATLVLRDRRHGSARLAAVDEGLTV